MNLRVLGTVAFLLAVAATASATPPSDPVKDCIRAWAEARYGAMGYNHIVHIANACGRVADCRVTTNVNPDPTTVSVPPHESIEVVTWRGSPAREFTPNVVCQMRN